MTKKVSYLLIERDTDQGRPMYDMLDVLVDEHHDDLTHAKIALAWNRSWTPDVDGKMKLGSCRKANDLDRELSEWDFVISLNPEFWNSPHVEDWQRRALLDHELCHGAMSRDGDGEPIEDEKGRKVYRVRKHDIEEFTAVIRRHGVYKRDLEDFAAALKRAKQPKLFREEDEAQPSVRRAIEQIRPRPGSDADSVSIIGPDGLGVKLNADGSNEQIGEGEVG